MSIAIRMLALLPTLCVAQIRVLSPTYLEEDPTLDGGIIYGTTAIFGAPEYGRRALGEVVYFSPEHEHCETSDFEKYPSKDNAALHDMKIFAVDRGGCPFEKKVRLAQDRGADAVIVVDFPCSKQKEIAINDGHPDTACRDSESIQRIVMADTSGARDIHIPSILIPRAQGEKLVSAVTASRSSSDESSSDKQVVVMLLWDIPRSDFVSMDLWMSSAATDTSYFLSQFTRFAKELGPLLQFVPRYSLSQMRASDVYKSSSCMRSILPGGEEAYMCDSQFSPLGQAVVKEDARQLCIWHSSAVTSIASSGKSVTHAPKYWNYVSEFFENCHPSRNGGSDTPFSDMCAESVMKDVGIDASAVNWCLVNMKPPVCRDSSVRKPECSPSFHLLQDQAAHQAWSPHALRINGWRYSGPLEASVVLKTLCQGFSNVPDICNEVPILHPNAYTGLSTGMTWFLGISLLSVVCLTFYVYRRNLKHTLRSVMREEVMLEVRSQMADYAMLAEDEEIGNRMGSRVLEMTRFTPQQLPPANQRPKE